jgi:hypothetical protein
MEIEQKVSVSVLAGEFKLASKKFLVIRTRTLWSIFIS